MIDGLSGSALVIGHRQLYQLKSFVQMQGLENIKLEPPMSRRPGPRQDLSWPRFAVMSFLVSPNPGLPAIPCHPLVEA